MEQVDGDVRRSDALRAAIRRSPWRVLCLGSSIPSGCFRATAMSLKGPLSDGAAIRLSLPRGGRSALLPAVRLLQRNPDQIDRRLADVAGFMSLADVNRVLPTDLAVR